MRRLRGRPGRRGRRGHGLVAVLGFYYGDAPLLGIVANNAADSALHVVIAVIALYLGFGMKSEVQAAS